MLRRKLPEDNPEELLRIRQLVYVTTTFTFWYSAIAHFLVLWYFVLPEIVWMLIQKKYEIYLLMGFATHIDTLIICSCPLVCRLAFSDYLWYCESDERFQRRQEGFFGRLNTIASERQ